MTAAKGKPGSKTRLGRVGLRAPKKKGQAGVRGNGGLP
jgi:hypothetical protein